MITKFPVIIITIFFALGIVFGSFFNADKFWIIVLLSVTFPVLIISFFAVNKRYFRGYVFSIISFLISFVLGFVFVQKDDNNYKSDSENYYKIKILETKKKSIFAHILNKNDSLPDNILVNFQESNNLSISDEVLIFGKINRIEPSKNPYQFDYSKYLKNKNIYHRIFVKKDYFKILKKGNSLMRKASDFRGKIITKLSEFPFKKRELSVIKALILGYKNDLSKDLKQSYSASGAMHILAVSGLHIGVITYILNMIFFFLRGHVFVKTFKTILVLVLLWFYAFLVGLSPSIIRSCVMFSFIVISLQMKRPKAIYNNIFGSALLLLLYDPNYIFDIGFQLSYSAVLGIVWMSKNIEKIYTPEHFLFKKIWQIMVVSSCAQLATFPLSIYYFDQFPTLFLLTNIVILPGIFVIILFGIIFIILAFLGFANDFVFTVYNQIIFWMNEFIYKVSSFENILIENIIFSKTQVLLAFTTVLMIGFWIDFKKHKYLLYSLVMIFAIQIITINDIYKKSNYNEFIVFNSYKTTVFSIKENSEIKLFSSDFEKSKWATKNYVSNERIHKTISKNIDRNIYSFDDKNIFVSNKILPDTIPNIIDFLVVTNSPKVDFDKIIIPKNTQIIIDNNNYKSYKNNWLSSIYKNQIYDTNTNGAFAFRFQ